MSYRQLHTDTWVDKEFRRSTTEERLFFLYAISAPISNSAGFYRLPLEVIEFDMRYPTETVEAILQKQTLYKYDFSTEQIFIKNFLKYNKCTSASQMRGLASAIKSLEWCELFVDFFYAVKRYCNEDFAGMIPPEIVKYTYYKAKERNDEVGVVVKAMTEAYI